MIIQKKLNICIVTQQFKNIFSGVGLHANILVNYFLNNDHSVTVILPENQKPESHQTKLRIKTVKNPLFASTQARWFFLSLSFSRAIKELSKAKDFDLIHFTDVRESFFSNTQNPVIGNINDTYSAELESLSYYKKYYSDWLFRWVYYLIVHQIEARRLSKPSCVIANSRYTYETIKKNYPRSHIKLALCYKAVDIDRYTKMAKSKEYDPAKIIEPIILFVGGNMQRKGVPDIIDASPNIIKQFPNTKFIIVGGDKAIDKMREKCREKRVESNFHFTGWCPQDKIINYYKNATLFIMPSLIEALGVTFLEAMAAGLPVIGTNVGGIPEIIQDGVNGRLVPVNSPKSIAKTIIELLSDETTRKKLSKNAIKTVRNFNIENMMKCTTDVYKKVISG